MNQDDVIKYSQIDRKYDPPGPDSGIATDFPLPELTGKPTEFLSGEIVLECDQEYHSTHPRTEQDLFTKKWRRWTETVRSGDGIQVFTPLDIRLQSRIDPTRVQYLSRKITDALNGTCIPGNALCVSIERRQARLVHMLDTDDGRQLWERLRRIAINVPELHFLYAAPPTPQVFQLDDIRLHTVLYYLRQSCDAEGVVRMDERKERPHRWIEVQNYHLLPTKEELIATGKCDMLFTHPELKALQMRDEKLRAERYGRPDLFPGSGKFTPANAGLVPADWTEPMIDLRIM